MKALLLGLDVVREAAARKVIWALGLAVTLALVAVALGMKAEVVDGALAATRLFGNQLQGHSPEEMLRPLFQAAAYVTYYAGLPFGFFATAEMAPRLLAPGRVEHLLSLPLKRSEILLGTLLGVLFLATACGLYGALGLVAILFLKTGFLNLGPLVAAGLAIVAFIALYSAMLATAVLVRSAALCGGVGLLLFMLGIVAGHRRDIDHAFEVGWPRGVFDAFLLPLPKISTLAEIGAALAGNAPVDTPRMISLLLGTLGFGAAFLLLAIARFMRKDY